MTAVGESADTAVAPARARPDAPAGGGLRGRVALRRYLTAYGLSHAGSAVSAVAVPTLAVVVLHATAVQVAVLAVLGQLLYAACRAAAWGHWPTGTASAR